MLAGYVLSVINIEELSSPGVCATVQNPAIFNNVILNRKPCVL